MTKRLVPAAFAPAVVGGSGRRRQEAEEEEEEVHLSGEGWAWGLAEEDLEHVDVKIAPIPWDRLDELRGRVSRT